MLSAIATFPSQRDGREIEGAKEDPLHNPNPSADVPQKIPEVQVEWCFVCRGNGGTVLCCIVTFGCDRQTMNRRCKGRDNWVGPELCLDHRLSNEAGLIIYVYS